MSALIVLFLLPLVWSGAAAAVRQAARRNRERLDDTQEKSLLAAMLAPVAFGAAVLVLWRLVPVHIVVPDMPALPVMDAPPEASAPFTPPRDLARFDLLAWLVPAILAAYGAGLSWKAVRLSVALIRIRRIAASAALATMYGTAVRLSDAAISPLAWGRSTIILPLVLATSLGEEELRLVLSHEREHLRRRDPFYFVLLAWIDAVFWFNPFVLWQTRRCRTAAEIACDRAATRQSPSHRQAYARLLVGTLRLLNTTAQESHRCAPAVFAPEGIGGYRQRLQAILRPGSARPRRRFLYAALAVAAVPFAFAQFAYSQEHRSDSDTHWEPVPAADAGKVVWVGRGKHYGPNGVAPLKEIKIDYGDGVTADYSMPDNTGPRIGDSVAAGQLLTSRGSLDSVEIQFPPAKGAHGPVCRDGRTLRCELLSSGMMGKPDGYTVAYDDAWFVLPDWTVHADIVFIDERTRLVSAVSNVRLVKEDNRARLQREETRVPPP